MPTSVLSPIAVPFAGVATCRGDVGAARGGVRLLVRHLLLLSEMETLVVSAPAACSVAEAISDKDVMMTEGSRVGPNLKRHEKIKNTFDNQLKQRKKQIPTQSSVNANSMSMHVPTSDLFRLCGRCAFARTTGVACQHQAFTQNERLVEARFHHHGWAACTMNSTVT